jgi:hypothetical protein
MIVLFNDRQVLSAAPSSDCRLRAIDGLSARNAIRSDTSHEQARLAVLPSILSAQANNHG